MSPTDACCSLTLTERSWTARHVLFDEERGLVVGKYGDTVSTRGCDLHQRIQRPFVVPSRHQHSRRRATVQAAVEADATVLFLTARDARHHCGTESDLKQRGLWRDGMRLVCKPHRELVGKAEFKEQIVAVLPKRRN